MKGKFLTLHLTSDSEKPDEVWRLYWDSAYPKKIPPEGGIFKF